MQQHMNAYYSILSYLGIGMIIDHGKSLMHPNVALKVTLTTSHFPVLLTVLIKQQGMFQWIPVKMTIHYLKLLVVSIKF